MPAWDSYLTSKKQLLVETAANLEKLSADQVNSQLQPGKWSQKEILGHLIDSAINNTARFINGQKSEQLIFTGYDQDIWVERSAYQNADWNYLITLWHNLNLNIIRIANNIDRRVLNKMYNRITFTKSAGRILDQMQW